MAVINRNGLRKEIIKKRVRIGEETLNFFIRSKEKEIKQDVEMAVRNARISGRKTIKKEDIQER